MEKEEPLIQQIATLPQRILTVTSAAAAVLIIFLLIAWLKLLPEGIIISAGLFISLPLIFVFVFGVLTNNPNFSSKLRQYGFVIYLAILLGIFFYYLRPEGVTHCFKLLLQFFLGLVIALVVGLFYVFPFRLLKDNSYRIRAGFSFLISTAITIISLLILNYFGLLNWLN